MKKIVKYIINILIILVLIAFIYIILTNKKVSNQIIVSVNDMRDNITNFNSEEIDENVKINSLQIKNCTFYYNTLTDTQKEIYLALLSSINNLDTTVKLKKYEYIDEETTMNDIKISMQNLFLDHPEIFYVKTNYTVSTVDLIKGKRVEVLLEYTVADKNELDNKINEVSTVLDELVNEAKGKDIFEAELYLHDKIATMCKYYRYENIEDIPEECHSIYGCVVNKSAVCDGLSKTLQIALDKLGIESILVSGSIQDQLHAWNLVKLEDEWYHVDITSDKSLDKDFNDDSSVVIHSYFNITDEKILKTNAIEDKQLLPKATGTKYNYYIYKDKYISNKDNFESKLTKILSENTDDKIAEFGIENNVEYVSSDKRRFNYYNILDSFILTKQK